MNQTFWIGIYPGLCQEQLDYVAEKFEEFFLVLVSDLIIMIKVYGI
jgi:hypothetical protein